MSKKELDYGSLTCTSTDEYARLVRVLYRDLTLQYEGKKFWMWIALLQMFVMPIIEPLITAFWKGYLS